MKKYIENIGINLITTLILAVVSYLYKWNIYIPLWLCFIFIAFVILIEKISHYIIKQYRIRKAISSYTYGAFGHSCSYKWEYVKNPNGIYGYEPVNIQIAESQTSIDTPNHKVFRFTHFVDEQKIKLIIRLTLMYMVEKKSQKEIYPILEYLHQTERK